MRSFLGVPIFVRGVVYGDLYLAEKHGGEFTEEDEELTMLLAAQAAVAVENARLYTLPRQAPPIMVAASGGKSAAEVGKYLARLHAQITTTHEPAVDVLGFLAGDKHQPSALGDDYLGVRFRTG